jgi:hypothetical protein
MLVRLLVEPRRTWRHRPSMICDTALREVREIEAEEEKAGATPADILVQLTALNERLGRLESSRRES